MEFIYDKGSFRVEVIKCFEYSLLLIGVFIFVSYQKREKSSIWIVFGDIQQSP